MATAYLLAVDQGTTSTRAVVYDAAGRAVGAASRELTQHYPRPGWVEHDADDIWRVTSETLAEVVREMHDAGETIAAIGITNQRETVVVWDRRTGTPRARAIVFTMSSP